ncbi:Peroxin 13, N-terminal region-domain-containing protein [Multifurca ochricompacta]|uniref:Peroxisomal membrane protein PEX13 n=1 Tax=Multifurca ochricompacta TaxID=376703 RepID=A0AAD4M819_9AGAM|nr:Peroxin 13, N-terminal region-domain-containing protein [Multifurca ochricompacta]
MSHGYSLRPNAKGRMEKRLNAYVAAFGEENKNNIIAAPSETGQGVHLTFDSERSLAPVPGGQIEQGGTNTTEDVIIIDSDSDSDSDSMSDSNSDSDSESHSDTPSVHTPPRGNFEPTSALRTPRPNRRQTQQPENWREGSVASSVSLADSMASIVERSRVLHSRLKDVQDGRRRAEEHRREEGQRVRIEQIHRLFEEQERILRERLAALQEEYAQVVMQLSQEEMEVHVVKEELEMETISNNEYTPTETSDCSQKRRSPTPGLRASQEAEIRRREEKYLPPWAGPGNVLPNVSNGPSRLGPQVMEDHENRQARGLRRHHAQQLVMPSPRDANTAAGRESGVPFIVVARRVQVLGPSGTAVFDEETLEPKVEIKHFRLRVDELDQFMNEEPLMVSPPKPWERGGTIAAAASSSPTPLASTSSPAPIATTSAPAATTATTSSTRPSAPTRPAPFTSPTTSTNTFSSPFSTPYNRFNTTSYSPYGSSLYGGMGNLGGYGSYGYGGYGMNGMYGGTYGGGMGMGMGGMGGMGMYGQPGMPYDPSSPSVTQALESTTATTFALLHSVVQTFAGLSQMLESTFMATHSSFFALAGVVDQFAQLRNALGSVSASSGSTRGEMRGEFREFLNGRPVQGPMPAPPKASKKPLVFFFLAFLGIPYAMHKLVKIFAERAAQQQQLQQQQGVIMANGQVLPPLDPSQLSFARTLYPFQASTPSELSLQENEIVAIMGKLDPNTVWKSTRGWR